MNIKPGLIAVSLGLALGGTALADMPVVTEQAQATAQAERNVAQPMTEADVAHYVREAGYTNVHDIEYLEDRGVWKAEADDATGEDFELHVDAKTGKVVHIEDD